MNRKTFFDALRGGALFPHGFSTNQINGLDRLFDVWDEHFSTDPIADIAYNLATSYHETAQTMQPIKELGSRSYFNKYEPGTTLGKMLGNTQPGDGYRFRGEGDVQNTGRRNAKFASDRLNKVFNLGIDLVANPDKRGDPFVSAMSLFLGNKEGWWTGKDLHDYIDGIDESEAEDLREFIEARRVVNGTDKAKAIAGYAVQFLAALKKASA